MYWRLAEFNSSSWICLWCSFLLLALLYRIFHFIKCLKRIKSKQPCLWCIKKLWTNSTFCSLFQNNFKFRKPKCQVIHSSHMPHTQLPLLLTAYTSMTKVAVRLIILEWWRILLTCQEKMLMLLLIWGHRVFLLETHT